MITIIAQSTGREGRLSRSRIEETNPLAPLNDRLAAYIERNQGMRNENASARAQVRKFKYLYSYTYVLYPIYGTLYIIHYTEDLKTKVNGYDK